MEIKLNAGVILTIPTGCKANIKGNKIIIGEKFKDGDILRSNLTDNVYHVKTYKEECESKKISYLVTDGEGHWSHGKTLKEAKRFLIQTIQNIFRNRNRK